MSGWGRFRHAVWLLAALSQHAVADVRLPRLLSEGVILQHGVAVSIWGWADGGEAVKVYLDGEPVGDAEPVDGHWRVQIAPVAAGGPHALLVQGENSIVVRDVYFGDVWVASGQSNMELPMERVKEKYPSEIAAADYPQIREFAVPRRYAFDAPLEDLDGGAWTAATPETVLNFSAVAWFFARETHRHLGIPVGIVRSAYGGSPAEGWMSEEALQEFPHYVEIAKRYRDERYLKRLQDADKATADAWYRKVDEIDRGLQDATRWSEPELDDSGWAEMTVPGFWSCTDAGPVNGVVWFRRNFELPRSAEGEPAKLLVGRIVDADTTYMNGIEVGRTTYQYPPRRYDVGAGILRAGENTIAVRIVSSMGEGGFVDDKPYELQVGETRIDLKGSWRFRVGAVSEAMPPARFVDYKQPLGFYNAMLAPLQDMTIKGVIWYQGESNVERAKEYRSLFPAMIRDWRRHWGQGNFPFIFVQLANFQKAVETPSESAWAELRDAQLSALAEPGTAMAVAIDVGEWNDIHPLNKKAVGQRLALAARRIAYGERNLVSSGPIFRSMTERDGRLTLEFDFTGCALTARGGPLRGFAISGSDGKYTWAQAEIEGDKVVVWNDSIAQPAAVRYAWADNPVRANLYNCKGLPASPFQASVVPERN